MTFGEIAVQAATSSECAMCSNQIRPKQYSFVVHPIARQSYQGLLNLKSKLMLIYCPERMKGLVGMSKCK